VRIRKALAWVAFWVALALLFNLGIYLLSPVFAPNADRGQLALQFFGGYIIELSLSLDNLFLFLIVFASFNVPSAHQRRVLNYGIAGAVVLRFSFILLGSALVSRFAWLLYVFGGILVISGVMMLMRGEKEKDFKQSRILSVFNKTFPFTGTLEGDRFLIKKNGKRYATLLLAVLVIIESSDIIFAVDSIPAIFSITLNPFIVFTSNIFAILGLRSFYFVLERLSQMFRFVKYGVALILLYTGIKLIFNIEDIMLSIGIIAVILLVSIFASMLIKEKKPREPKKQIDD
jgi:tellurite resistance protein TerC